MAFAFVAAIYGVEGQTYTVGPDAAKNQNDSKDPKNAQTTQPQSPSQQLGFGSNIQNARLTRAAQLALQHGDHAQAFDYAQRAAQAAPNDPQLWFLLGYAARLDGKLQMSVDAYTHGLHLSPTSLDGLSGLAQTYSLMGRTEEAKNLLKQVVSSDPRRKDDALLLGDIYMRSADYTNAIEWLGRAERMQPAVRPELMMAICYQHLKQMELANQYLEMARRRSPDNPEVERSMAGYYRETGNYAGAIASLKSIRKPTPDITAELAYTYQLDGKPDDSAKLYSQAADEMPKDMPLQLSAAQAEVAIGSIEKANPFLDRAARIDPGYYRLHAIRGEIAKSQDREQEAVSEYNTAQANLPAAPVEGPLYGIQLHMDLMNLYKELNDENAARQQLEIAQTQINGLAGQMSNSAQFLRQRASIRVSAGDTDGALNDIKQALAINAHDNDDLQLDGDILMKLGRPDEAIAVYKQILTNDANNRYALISLGYASRAAGRDKDAEAYFYRLAHANPTLYIPYLALGDLYTSRREFSKAEDAYGKGYGLAPKRALIVAGGMNAAVEAHDLTLAAGWMARVTPEMNQDPQVLRETERYLNFSGKYQESAEVGREAIKVLPRDRDVVVYLGYDLLHLKKYDDLLSLTTEYLNLLPKEPDIPLLEGYVHKHEGLSELALLDFTEALNRDPNVVTAHVNRGYMLNDLHQPQPAADDFEAALKREPDNGEAHLGLAYTSLDLHRPQAALRQADLAEKTMGDSRDIHVVRATAYGREEMLMSAANEYKAALKFTPNDGALHFGLGNTYFAERRYHDAIDELQITQRLTPDNAEVYALLARSYASLQDRTQTLLNVKLAIQHSRSAPAMPNNQALGNQPSTQSDILLSAGEALSTLGDQSAAMDSFGKAMAMPGSDRIGVRLAIAAVMAQQGHIEDAERQIALAMMESEAGTTAAPTGKQYIAAADVFRTLHDYQLSQTYLERAKAAGASDAEVRIGLANNDLAVGDTARAQAELAAVSATSEGAPDYQYLLAEANVYRQQHHSTQELTAFAQAANAEGEDQTAQQDLLSAGADEGFRVKPYLSLLSDVSVAPIFEDTTVYVLDSKLDATFAVPSSSSTLLPPPRSSVETQATAAFHLHLAHMPTTSGFYQVRNSQGEILVPSTNTIVNRNTTDYTLNYGVNPTIKLGRNTLTFDSGIQATIRRDSESPVQMDQNLFRVFTYVSTSSFFNVLSVSGYVIRESGPFTESNLHSAVLTGAVDFRVGAPWGKTALVTGWGANHEKFSPVSYEDYLTSSYVGLERKFSKRLTIRAVVEDLRAWRIVGTNSGIAQNLRPAGTIDYIPKRNWNVEVSSAYSNNRGFHVYDAVQTGFSVSYAKPIRHKFDDNSGDVVLQYPIQFSAGMQQETFFNFPGGQSQQLRPFIRITIF